MFYIFKFMIIILFLKNEEEEEEANLIRNLKKNQ